MGIATNDLEHFGVNLIYSRGPLPAAAAEQLRRRRPGLDDLIPQSRAALNKRVDEWLDAGFSKFLLCRTTPAPDWTAELELLADGILDRRT